MMKINLAQSAGFCFGVKRALKIAYQAAASESQIEALGDIVHNKEVAAEIAKAGIKTVKRLRRGRQKTLLIRAHGTGLNTFRQARSLGYKVVDATCPMVCEIHKIVRQNEKKGFAIIIIGDKRHAEVKGILGQLKGPGFVVDPRQALPAAVKNIKRAAVVVQSTQDWQRVMPKVERLRQVVRELKFFNTICNPTRIKQQEARIMPAKNDTMLIIGSKTSANTKRLYEIAKSLNWRSYWIQSPQDIKPRWLKGVNQVGICAGASTPDATTRAVIEYIKSLDGKG